MTAEIQRLRKTRPVNLDLMSIHFPVTAIVSILHRLSGVLLFVSIPFLLWILSLSLSTPEDFAFIQAWLARSSIKFMVWVVFAALVYHLLAGIRHFVMDIGFCESLKAGRISAYMTLGLTLILAILLGIKLW